jgi:hypothetical protein
MRTALLNLLIITAAAAQEQAGRIEGVVLDAASHQPVKKAVVSMNFTGTVSTGTQYQDPPPVTTDVIGTFAFHNLPTGQYQLTVMHQNYPQSRMGGPRKTIQGSDGGNAGSITMELVPGAAVSGHIVDEDGDPLSGCMVEVHSARNFHQGIAMMRPPMSREDGSYRIYGVPPGNYTITAQCSTAVFQPRPLSEGPDPPPSLAYPVQFYPAASELKSAEIVELSPGAEKTDVNFQMRPVQVTHIHGTLAAAGAEWRGRNDLRVQLLPLHARDPRMFGFGAGGRVNAKDGSFELRQVFPGSYRLAVFSQNFSGASRQERITGSARSCGWTLPISRSNSLCSFTLPQISPEPWRSIKGTTRPTGSRSTK